MRIFGTIFLFIIFTSGVVYAHGECCLSRSLFEATTSNVTTASNFGLSLQYEYTNMETIRDGSDRVGHDTLLDDVVAEWPRMPEDGKVFFYTYTDDYAKIYPAGYVLCNQETPIHGYGSLCYQ